MICPKCGLPYNRTERIKAEFVERDAMCYPCFNLEPKVIAIDFDATLTDYSGWKGIDHKGMLLDGAKEFLEALTEMGFILHIVTARPVDGIQEWLIENEIDHLIKSITNLKIAAFCYIDDRAIQFNKNYDTTLEQIKSFVPWYKR